MPKSIRRKTSKKPESLKLEAFLPYRLSLASNQVSDLIARTYRDDFQLSVAEWRLISILAESESSTPRELVKLSKMDKVTVSRAAIALTVAGLVVKRANPGDGRSHHLRLSSSGRAAYKTIAPRVKNAERQLLDGFSKVEVDTLTKLLRRLEAAAESDAIEAPRHV